LNFKGKVGAIVERKDFIFEDICNRKVHVLTAFNSEIRISAFEQSLSNIRGQLC